MNDDKQNNILDKAKKVVKNHLGPGIGNALIQSGAEHAGLVAGTALSMAKGKSIGKAVLSGGLKGMAVGDIGASAVVPSLELYKEHKKQLGTAPSAKDYGKVLAANVAPTAAIWGGILGSRKLAQNYMKQGGIPAVKSVSGLNKVKAGMANMGHAIDTGLAGAGDAAKDYSAHLKSTMGRTDLNGAQKLRTAAKGAKPLTKAVGAIGGTSMLLDKGAELPSFLVTPHSIVDKKKQNMSKTSAEIDLLFEMLEK